MLGSGFGGKGFRVRGEWASGFNFGRKGCWVSDSGTKGVGFRIRGERVLVFGFREKGHLQLARERFEELLVVRLRLRQLLAFAVEG